jgi:hypothetical protein
LFFDLAGGRLRAAQGLLACIRGPLNAAFLSVAFGNQT